MPYTPEEIQILTALCSDGTPFENGAERNFANIKKLLEDLQPISRGPVIRGVLDGALNYGSFATMSVWTFNGTAQADTGENVTVYDWLLASGQSIASGTRVMAALDVRDGRYYVTSAQCG